MFAEKIINWLLGLKHRIENQKFKIEYPLYVVRGDTVCFRDGSSKVCRKTARIDSEAKLLVYFDEP
jgi:hypothetical protein